MMWTVGTTGINYRVETPSGPVEVITDTAENALRMAREIHERDVEAAAFLEAWDLRPPPPAALVALHLRRSLAAAEAARCAIKGGCGAGACIFRERWPATSPWVPR